MKEYERNLVDTLGADYNNLIHEFEGPAALHTANLVLGYKENEKKTLERVIRIIELSTQMLGVPAGKIAVSSDMPSTQVIKWAPYSETIHINIAYLREKDSIDDIKKLLIAINTAVFMKHIRAVVESSEELVCQYAKKMDWVSDWKNKIDPLENPRLFWEQKYVKDAVTYGIAFTENALFYANQALKKLREK